jgi:beta-phosphoglucomutase-like phosphatase (HAD superfamily)
VVIEDALVGIRAAKSTAMESVAVSTTHPTVALASERTNRIEVSFISVDAEDLRGL